MRSTNQLFHLRARAAPIRSPFTRPTTYLPPSNVNIHRKTKIQTDFNHLVHHAIPASAKGTSSRPAPGIKKEFYFVHFKDRIKFWNVTAGDRVIVADCIKKFRGSIGTVYWVDRTTNRLSLLEPEFWKEEKEKAHPDLPEFVRNVPVEFEYSTVRLMAPGSNEMYYENLREVDHEAVIIPNGGKRREINWTRIGTRHSIFKPRQQSEGEEIIPWPVQPNWSTNIQDSKKRLELRDLHFKKMQQQWDLENRRRNGEILDSKSSPRSHIHSRETRKDLFSSPMEAWMNTLDPSQYQDNALWLSTEPKILNRFPEYFSSPSRIGQADSLNLNALPELSVPDWELTAGEHTRRFKAVRWETKLNEKMNKEIEFEANRISKHLQIPVDRIKRLLQVVNYRPSAVELDKKAFIPSQKQIRKATIQLKYLRSKVFNRERLATLDLLPALESFNHSPNAQSSHANP